jgi:hypothetical protein
VYNKAIKRKGIKKMTAYELIQCLSKVPSDTPVKMFDYHQYLENGFQLMDDCYIPLDEACMMKGIGVVLNSAWNGIDFVEEDD